MRCLVRLVIVIVVVCPGQGSQKPGFLEPWLAAGSSRALLERYSEAAGLDLVRHGTESDADTIRDTAIAQPLIVAAGLLSLAALRERAGDAALGGVAGHSVGEITAAAAAGILSDDEALRFVSARGREMAKAASLAPSGMAAVLGGDRDAVLAAAAEHGLFPANFNGGGQIVVAGSADGIEALRAAPLRGTWVIPLQVAGAFHTPAMQPAVAALAVVASSLTPADPTVPIWTNRDGALVSSGHAFVDLLVGQVSSPVDWDACMAAMSAAGVTGLIELSPAGTLVGLAKRALRGLPAVAVTGPDDLGAAVELLQSDLQATR